MAKVRSSNLMWNVGFLLIVLAIGVLSYQFLVKRKEGFTESQSVIKKIKNGNGVLVVTMENCPHCESMKKDLQKLSENDNIKGYFAWVDGSNKKKSEEQGISDLSIQSFPTILSFKDGIPDSYRDGRSYEELLDLVNSTKSA